jgi:hypothetical protein
VFEKIVYLINLLRPKFYNKITWLVVGSGVFLLSTPLWQEILVSFLNINYSMNLNATDNSLIGIFTIALGLLYHLITTSIFEYTTAIENRNNTEKIKLVKNRELEHDLKVFKDIDLNLKERDLLNYIESIETDHSFTSSSKSKVYPAYFFAEESKYEFIDTELNRALEKFVHALTNQIQWCSCHFWAHPSHIAMEDPRYCLHPDLNEDRGGRSDSEADIAYSGFSRTLNQLTEETVETYKAFRKIVKRKLYI